MYGNIVNIQKKQGFLVAFIFYSQLNLIFMILNDTGYLLEEFNKLLKEKTHIKSVYGCFIVLIFYPTPGQQILVYTISAQVVRLTTLPISA